LPREINPILHSKKIAMRKQIIFTTTGMVLMAAGAFASNDCLKVAEVVKTTITNQPEQVLQVVEKQVAESPNCACEIVKSAIKATHADVELVAQIVETAILAAPEQMRIISQCAIAVAPDALPAIQAVIARLDPNSGVASSSAKHSGKGGKEVSPMQEQADIGNPLDFPGSGPVGPTGGLGGGGMFGGDPFLQPYFPGNPFTPPLPPVLPPVETPVDP